jgi:hypothetical protein
MQDVILLVEHQASRRAALEAILKDAGYAVLSAADPIDALEMARDRKVDLLLSEVLLPIMIGPDLAIRLAERYPGVRVVFISEYADHVLFPGGPGVEFIRWPFRSLSLIRKIRKLLRLESARVALRF